MGCAKSTEEPKKAEERETKGDTAITRGQSNRRSDQAGKLLEKYTLGDVLGQGAFGIVYDCMKRDTKEHYAVKMVDLAQSPLNEIKRECEMLRKLSHPCVVKLHDVFYEQVFVCIVLDLIKGGDMINGMQRHWKSKGTIPIQATQNCGKQMLNSVKWIHSQNVVHRDLKADNFLMDRKEIQHKDCRLFLSDFGTVVACEPGQHINGSIGTKLYWSPEFHDNNYGQKVDIWALGVVMYGLTSGRFPFKTEQDVKTRPLVFPPGCPKVCQDLVRGMLERDEEKRYAAEEALNSPFLSAVKSADWDDVQAMEQGFKPEMKEAGGNAAVAERRQELIERLQEANDTKVGNMCSLASAPSTDFRNGFDVYYPNTKMKHRFDWWPKEKVQAEKLVDTTARPYLAADAKNDMAVKAPGIVKTLEGHGIDTRKYGKDGAIALNDFAAEVLNGHSRVMMDAAAFKTLVRVVDVVLLRLHCNDGTDTGMTRILMQTSEQHPNGGNITRNKLPHSEKKPHENGVQAARRIVEEQLGMLDCEIDFNFHAKECYKTEEQVAQYPGIKTVYLNEIFEGILQTTDAEIIKRIGAHGPGSGFKKNDLKQVMRNYEWHTEEDLTARQFVFKAPKEGNELSTYVYPPCGLEEEELCQFLIDSDVDVSQFGEGTNGSLQEFSGELLCGEAVLQRSAKGKVQRIVDVVILQVSRKDGAILVEETQTAVNGTTKTLNRLPAVKRRSDENQFVSANRVLKKILRIGENSVNISPYGVCFCSQEKPSVAFCGLPSMYQKQFIQGTLVGDDDFWKLGPGSSENGVITARPVREGLISL